MKTLKQIIIAIFILIISGKINSQVVTDWIVTYDGTDNSTDFINDMVLDAAGNIYVAGFSVGNGSSSDFVTIKYNPQGSPQWIKRYNGTGNDLDNAHAIAVDDSGNVYVTGNSRGTTFGSDFAIIKYNSAGVQKWAARYSGSGSSSCSPKSIAVDNSGNVFVSGDKGLGSESNMLTIKYNSSGIQQWVSEYNGSGNSTDQSNSMIIDESGNVYVTGSSVAFITSHDCTTIKYNTSGVIQWVKKYNGPANGEDGGNFIASDISGNVYVTGYSAGSGTNFDYVTIKYNSAGVQQWASRYNGTGNSEDKSRSLAIDIIGNVYVAGESIGPQTYQDYASIKYNSAGVQQWVSRYNGPGNVSDIANSIAVDGLGNIFVTGESNGEGNNLDMLTIKYNSAGAQQWIDRYNGSENGQDFATSIALDNLGKVYVAGQSSETATGPDYAVIKYSGEIQKSLNLNAFIEGFYSPNTNIMVSDTLKVYLRESNAPYVKVDSAKSIIDEFGNGVFSFSNADDGINYYIVLKHRNSIETWSSSGNAFSSGSLTYNFTNSANKAFGSNQIQIDNSPTRFGIFSGDVNQDEIVDVSDISSIYNHAITFASGYLNTDVNGDGFIDVTDLLVTYNNAANFRSVIKP